MRSPAISVVMPLFNGARYVAESVASVLGQRYAAFELLVCDDGSSDESAAIVRSFRDDRIRLLANDRNRGLFPTLNRLVGEARGEYVRFWAQDDRMHRDCLAAEADFWKRVPGIALSYCQGNVIDDEGVVVAPAPDDPTPEVLPPWLSTQIALYHGCLQANISTVTVRRDVFDEVGVFAALRVSGDFDMWTRISTRHSIGFVRQALVDVRRHAAQFSQSPAERLTFVREDRAIVARLLDALPERVRPHVADYRRRRQLVWLMNAIVAATIAGDLVLARALAAELRPEASLPATFARWALTANGRWWRPRALYVTPRGDASESPARLPGVLQEST